MNDTAATELEPATTRGAGRRPLMTGLVAGFGLVVCFVLCFAAAAFGAQFGPGDWYASLRKPSWNPPNWIFGPVWTALYSMMSVAAWLVWRQGGWQANWRALTAFLIQLGLNAVWSWLFFGLRNPGLALVEILFLWASILWTWRLFRPISPAADWLLLPYLAWVSFAALLNGVLWRLNAS
jgi:benzodiazapine receptor